MSGTTLSLRFEQDGDARTWRKDSPREDANPTILSSPAQSPKLPPSQVTAPFPPPSGLGRDKDPDVVKRAVETWSGQIVVNAGSKPGQTAVETGGVRLG